MFIDELVVPGEVIQKVGLGRAMLVTPSVLVLIMCSDSAEAFSEAHLHVASVQVKKHL